MGLGLAVGGAEPKHKKISDSQGQQFQIALILNGTSGGISGINISMQSLPFMEVFAEWNPAGCCFPSVFLLWRGTRAVFSSPERLGVLCLLPKPPEEGIKLQSEPARSWARPRQEGDKNESVLQMGLDSLISLAPGCCWCLLSLCLISPSSYISSEPRQVVAATCTSEGCPWRWARSLCSLFL